MRRTLAAIALCALALVLALAVDAPGAAPVYGQPPKIEQQGDRLCVVDNAGWFTQGDDKATRYVHVWYWNGGNVFGVPAPPWRTEPERVQPGEGAACLPLGPSNIGGSFHVVEYGGVESIETDDGHWIEWGREQAADRSQASGARSNTVVVVDWRPAPPTEAELLAGARAGTRPLVLWLRARGHSWNYVHSHPYGIAYYDVYGGR